MLRIKSKKLIEDSIRQLKSAANPDDETKRHLYTQQIKWWIQQSEEEIEALKGSIRSLAKKNPKCSPRFSRRKKIIEFRERTDRRKSFRKQKKFSDRRTFYDRSESRPFV